MQSARLSHILTVVGAGLVALAMTHFLTGDLSSLPRVQILSNLLVTGGAGIGLIYIGHWHASQSFSAGQTIRVIGWAIGGAIVLTAASILAQPLIQTHVTKAELLHILLIYTAIGLVFGAAVGSFEARALENAAAQARTETTLETHKREQERWSELNTLLRHYILNSVTVVDHRLSALRQTVPAEAHTHLETIEDRMQTIATIGTHVDRLGPSPDENESSTVDDLQAVFENAASLADTDDGSIAIDVPEVNERLRVGQAVETDIALFLEALESVTQHEGSVECDCKMTDEEVTCFLRASPAELPTRVEASMFEPIDRYSGLKLYLAESSMNSYADVRLVQNSDGMVAFEIDFEKADSETSAVDGNLQCA